MRRPHNFAKSPPYFWLRYIQSRFLKILWPSQNIWTLLDNSKEISRYHLLFQLKKSVVFGILQEFQLKKELALPDTLQNSLGIIFTWYNNWWKLINLKALFRLGTRLVKFWPFLFQTDKFSWNWRGFNCSFFVNCWHIVVQT